MAEIDDVQTIDPPPAAIMPGSTARAAELDERFDVAQRSRGDAERVVDELASTDADVRDLVRVADARATLRAAGFRVTVTRQETDDESLDGLVMSQDPAGLTEADLARPKASRHPPAAVSPSGASRPWPPASRPPPSRRST